MTHTRTMLAVTFVAVLSVGLAGCAKKKPAPPPPLPPPPAATPAPPPPPTPPPTPSPAPAPPTASEQDLFNRKSLEQLNAEKPLADVFFDFDRSDLKDDARAALQKDSEWLRKWPYHQDHGRGPLRQPGHGRVQPRSRRSSRAGGEGVPREPRRRHRPRPVPQQGQGGAVLHRGERVVLVAEPARPLHCHGEVGRARPSRAEQGLARSPLLGPLAPLGLQCQRNVPRGSGRIRSLQNRTADHQIAGSRVHRLARGARAHLIVAGRGWSRADAGRHDEEILAAARADAGRSRAVIPPRHRGRPVARARPDAPPAPRSVARPRRPRASPDRSW